jgi:leucyl aminopeptidase
MDYSIETSPLDKLESNCIILGVYEDGTQPSSNQTVSPEIQGVIDHIQQRGDVNGKIGQVLFINYIPNSSIQRILLVGLGKPDKFNAKSYRKALSAAFNAIKKEKIARACCALAEIDVPSRDHDWNIRQIIELCHDAIYQYQATKSKPSEDNGIQLEHLSVWISDANKGNAEQALQQGLAIASGIELTKQLADLPGNVCTPTYLAEQAQVLCQQHPSSRLEILEEKDMADLGMGALLSVSRGSRQPAKMIIIEYTGTTPDTKPIVFVGKGLTFDAGGISLKPAAGMDEMKYDMCGGATVLGTLKAAMDMQLPLNIVGIIPASENMPDGDANKPGDIVTSMAGITIEVLNTDAEGRLILCDALTYAKKYNPDVVIDMATLTGACLVALGRVPSGLLGNNDDLCNAMIAAGETACDTLWRLPIWEEYQEQLKSNFADVANIGGKDAGTITAACFLARFTETFQWAHLDIAGTAWRSGNNKGATGRPVPLLCQYLLNRING